MKITKSILAILVFLLMSNSYAAEYIVTGSFVEFLNSHDSEAYYHNDVLPDFKGVWNLDTRSESIQGQNTINDISLVTLVKLSRFEWEAVVEQSGVSQFFDGQGHWNPEDYVFSYEIPVGKSNSGIASQAKGNLSCEGHSLICRNIKNANLDWEGVSLNIQFNENMTSFSGKMTIYEVSGSGVTKSETKLFYNISGEVN